MNLVTLEALIGELDKRAATPQGCIDGESNIRAMERLADEIERAADCDRAVVARTAKIVEAVGELAMNDRRSKRKYRGLRGADGWQQLIYDQLFGLRKWCSEQKSSKRKS